MCGARTSGSSGIWRQSGICRSRASGQPATRISFSTRPSNANQFRTRLPAPTAYRNNGPAVICAYYVGRGFADKRLAWPGWLGTETPSAKSLKSRAVSEGPRNFSWFSPRDFPNTGARRAVKSGCGTERAAEPFEASSLSTMILRAGSHGRPRQSRAYVGAP